MKYIVAMLSLLGAHEALGASAASSVGPKKVILCNGYENPIKATFKDTNGSIKIFQEAILNPNELVSFDVYDPKNVVLIFAQQTKWFQPTKKITIFDHEEQYRITTPFTVIRPFKEDEQPYLFDLFYTDFYPNLIIKNSDNQWVQENGKYVFPKITIKDKKLKLLGEPTFLASNDEGLTRNDATLGSVSIKLPNITTCLECKITETTQPTINFINLNKDQTLTHSLFTSK